VYSHNCEKINVQTFLFVLIHSDFWNFYFQAEEKNTAKKKAKAGGGGVSGKFRKPK
jgi:hypothetical protein